MFVQIFIPQGTQIHNYNIVYPLMNEKLAEQDLGRKRFGLNGLFALFEIKEKAHNIQ